MRRLLTTLRLRRLRATLTPAGREWLRRALDDESTQRRIRAGRRHGGHDLLPPLEGEGGER